MLIGRLTRDPEVRFLPSGMQVTSLSIAVSRNFKDKNGEWREETSFFDIESYGKLAERLGTQLSKGYQVLIEGSLRQDRWESPSGEKRSKVKIVADRIALIAKPGDRNIKSASPEENLNIPGEDFESDEDVPF
jgi:single-strand DNA-binding protein